MTRKIVLITGGLGYIGSHCAVELLNADFDVVILDSLLLSKESVFDRIAKVAGRAPLKLHKVDIRDTKGVDAVFAEHDIYCVIHCAALKAVGESVRIPLEYYSVNVTGTVNLLQCMERGNCQRIVFSSSSTVYGENNKVPFDESMPTSGNNPYGLTKVMIETVLKSCCAAPTSKWQVMLLRYFNPIGAHTSGLIGDDQKSLNNLLPYIEQVALGKRDKLTVFGGDYDTPDGTCLRDYIHVVDCARGHVAAIQNIKEGCEAINLGTSTGVSVKELITCFEKVTKVKVNWVMGDRRPGDIAASYADCSKAAKLLNWKAEFTVEDMISSAWNFRTKNPDGL